MGLTLDQLANAVAATGQIASSPPTDPETTRRVTKVAGGCATTLYSSGLGLSNCAHSHSAAMTQNGFTRTKAGGCRPDACLSLALSQRCGKTIHQQLQKRMDRFTAHHSDFYLDCGLISRCDEHHRLAFREKVLFAHEVMLRTKSGFSGHLAQHPGHVGWNCRSGLPGFHSGF
jgi:hypothetical protein